MSDTGREIYLAMHEADRRAARMEQISDYLQVCLDKLGMRMCNYGEITLRRDDLELLIEVLREHI